MKISGVPKSTFYYELKHQSDKSNKDKAIINEIKRIFNNQGQRYGVRRVYYELRNNGYIINHKKVQRIMNENGLMAITPKRKYHSYQGTVGVVADNLINRNFKADKPNLKWSTDISQFNCVFGKCYLSPLLDMSCNYIVSYDLSLSPNIEHVKTMLKKAFDKYEDLSKLVIHSDQGWQYQNPQYVKMLKEKGVTQSMSRKGNCFDNCIIESFFGHMKNEMFYGHENSYKTFDEFKKAVDDYIKYYNEGRINSKCNYLTPKKYKNMLMNL